MIAAHLLCLALCAQTPDANPSQKPNPEAGESPSIKVGSTIRIGRSFVSTNLAGLYNLAYLTYFDKGTPEARTAAIHELEKRGGVIELEEPTRAMVQAVSVEVDPDTKQPITIYRARLLDGPSVDRVIFAFSSQLSDSVEELKPPAPLDDKQKEVYRQAREAIGEAKTRAGRVDQAVRQVVFEREKAERLRIVAKKNGLANGELEAIIWQGEREDGRASRMVIKARRDNLRARNQMMLSALDRQLNAQLAEVLKRSEAQMAARRYYPPSGHFGPGAVINGPLGHPLDKMTFTDGGASVRPTGR